MSQATASRVLGGSARTVAEEYRSKVLAAAEALNYTVHLPARALQRATDFVALVADDLTTYTVGMVVAAMERQARTVDAFVTVASTRGVRERQIEAVRTMCDLRPRALVLTTSLVAENGADQQLVDELRAYEQRGGRVVIYGSVNPPFDSIRIDDRGSARLLGRHLGVTGHRKVIILTTDPERGWATMRAAGYTDGLIGAGVAQGDIRVVACRYSRHGAFETVTKLIEQGLGETDAIMATNDTLAVGALAACRAAGIAVPRQLSISGFDDIPLASDVTPALTTVALPHAEIGTLAVQLALDENERRGRGEVAREVILGRLIERESTTIRSASPA